MVCVSKQEGQTDKDKQRWRTEWTGVKDKVKDQNSREEREKKDGHRDKTGSDSYLTAEPEQPN